MMGIIKVDIAMSEFLVRLRKKFLFARKFLPAGVRGRFRKLIPEPSTFPKDDSCFVTRDNTNYAINRSDFVQWRIFVGTSDNHLNLAKKYLTPDSMVLDIGASVGGFSLRLATYAAENNFSNVQVHAFEPNPNIFKRYIDNLALNPSIRNVVSAHQMGLGSENTERLFQYADADTGVGRISQQGSPGRVSVKIQRLDDFVEKLNPPKISFIKMIVEGFEPEVFKGAWNTIEKYKPPIFFEVTRDWYKEYNAGSLDEILNGLSALKYRFTGEYYLKLIPYDRSIFDPLFQYNILATCDE